MKKYLYTTLLALASISLWPVASYFGLKTDLAALTFNQSNSNDRAFDLHNQLVKKLDDLNDAKIWIGFPQSISGKNEMFFEQPRWELKNTLSLIAAITSQSKSQPDFIVKSPDYFFSDQRAQYPEQNLQYFAHFYGSSSLQDVWSFKANMSFFFKFLRELSVEQKLSKYAKEPPATSLGARYEFLNNQNLGAYKEALNANVDFDRIYWLVDINRGSEVENFNLHFNRKDLPCSVDGFGVFISESTQTDFNGYPQCKVIKLSPEYTDIYKKKIPTDEYRLATRINAKNDLQVKRSHVPEKPLSVNVSSNAYALSEPIVFYIGNNTNEPIRLNQVDIMSAHSMELVKQISPLVGTPDAVPPGGCKSQRDGCGFSFQYKLRETPEPGAYFALFKGANGSESNLAFFLVRDQKSPFPNPIGVLYSEFTWQAYNTSGGGSLYTPNKSRLYEIKLNRPLNDPIKAGLPQLRHTPRAAIAIHSAIGRMDSDIIFDEDLHHSYLPLANKKLLVITGHSEYWTLNMYNNVKKFVAEGGRVLVAGGNTCWWKVRVENDRIWVNKGKALKNKASIFHNTGLFNNLNSPPESLLGLSYEFGGYPVKRKVKKQETNKFNISKLEYEQSDGMRLENASHPIFAGTGLSSGQIFGDKSSLMAVEIDGIPLNEEGAVDFSHVKSKFFKKNLKVLASGWSWQNKKKVTRVGTISEFENERGGKVLHLGSMGWYISILKKDPTTTKILQNSVEYLLN